MRIFWEKSYKIAAASEDPPINPRWPPAAGDFAPKPPRCYFYRYQFVEVRSSALNLFYYFEK